MSSSERRRVLVVDDSAFMRRVISDLVDAAPGFQVVATARNGIEAIQRVREVHPDIITMDVEMPELDGLQALERIMREMPLPVVVLSAAEAKGSDDPALRALDLGAVDFVRKPSGPISLDIGVITERLVAALHAAAEANIADLASRPALAATPPAPRAAVSPAPLASASRVVAIAASTGGPRALSEVIPRLQPGLGAAVLVVQHMPAGFTRSLATRLDAHCALPVSEAREGERLRPDRVYIAPGGYHMRVRRAIDGLVIALDEGPTVWGVRPAADPLFESLAACLGSAVLGVVLTGMGRDGTAGLQAIRAAGGRGLAQDRDSSVIFGMPQAAHSAGAAEALVPLGELPERIAAVVSRVPPRVEAAS